MQHFIPGRLFTPGDIIAIARLIAYRRKNGFKKCREYGFGAVRQIVGEPMIETAEPISPMVREFVSVQRATAELLAAECKRCGGCRLGRIL